MPWAAIDLLARAELRARWRALVALGLLAGLAAAAVLGALVVARRTSTAPERLRAATSPGDARSVVYGNPEVAAVIAELPVVERSWTASYGVGRIDGDPIRFVGFLAGPERPPGLLTPVYVEGHEPRAIDEVAITEFTAEQLGLRPGDRLGLTMLTADEVAQFDTGFGEPDGPRLDLRVSGVTRLPAATAQAAPALGSAALAAASGDEFAAGLGIFVDLVDRPGARAELQAEIDRINAETPRPPGAEEFPTADLSFPDQGDAPAAATARVLVAGLLVAAAVAALAGLLALAQAAARHHASGAGDQEIEAALGLTTGERVAARVAPAVVSAGVAAVVAAAGALVAAGVEPAGALGRIEPAPGWLPNWGIALLGAAATALVVLGTSALTARRALGRRGARHRAPSLARLVGGAPATVGLRFALDPGRGRTRVPVRSSLGGAVLGVAGVVAALTFGASVDRLASTPERWGWQADLNVVDATDAIAADLAADPRITDVAMARQAPVVLGTRTVSATTIDDVEGHVGWTVLEGRAPGRGEVVLGTRTARAWSAEVGDEVDGLDVVGIGIGPSLNNEHLGTGVLLAAADFDARKVTEPFSNALVGGAGLDDLADRYEVTTRFPPDEVRNLDELGNLPAALGGFLALLAAAALAHALLVTTRRRSTDLAVLRTIGFTPRQAGAALVTMALATVGVGLAAGAPLGVLVGRVVWWAVARSIGAGTDPSIPVAQVAGLALAFVAGAVVVALLPARRAARLRPAVLLRVD